MSISQRRRTTFLSPHGGDPFRASFWAFALAVPFRAVDHTSRDKLVRDAKQNKEKQRKRWENKDQAKTMHGKKQGNSNEEGGKAGKAEEQGKQGKQGKQRNSASRESREVGKEGSRGSRECWETGKRPERWKGWEIFLWAH